MAKKWKTVSKSKKRVIVERKSDGKRKTLLTPTGKVSKFKAEILNNVCITNDGKRKKKDNGAPMTLTKAQKAYRKGYIKALGEQSAIYKAVKVKQQRKAASKKK